MTHQVASCPGCSPKKAVTHCETPRESPLRPLVAPHIAAAQGDSDAVEPSGDPEKVSTKGSNESHVQAKRVGDLKVI